MTAISRFWQWGIVLAGMFALSAHAMPVKPNLEKILKEQQQQPRHYEPARAGWDGPEMVRPQDGALNPVYDAYGPASTTRAIRASLKTAIIPDPVATSAILMLILLWRTLRQRQQRQAAAILAVSHSESASKEFRAA